MAYSNSRKSTPITLPEITVRPYRSNKSNTVGFVDLKFYGQFVVTGLTVVYYPQKDLLFVSMPQRKDNEGNYRDTSFPISKEYRDALCEAILEEYQKKARDEALPIK